MYIKYADYTGKLAKGDIVLMSAVEWVNSGKLLKGVPVTITPDGKEPVETTEQPEPIQPEPIQPEPPSEQTPDLVLEIVALKERLAKVEEAPTVKAELIAIKEPIIKDPIISK